ncbi:DnaB helicase C-terminal domain-containing protein [Mammaliicoccus sciuri]|uniref:DnaB helicase C-terminal domain-containing protein n=1 Tax=Mammaliicoccus sciuri TaxID=1296 RepID=UPI002DBDF2AB|nr:DnaB helicase C-terminal domain-containing protein [Mammaliicoccus sciuri]MEB5649033.1 DnaB helicase C-terminal domain-containing protein [Mammaliicoccus sciuri]
MNIDQLTTEESVISNLITNPKLLVDFKLKPYMFKNQEYKKVIEFIFETGKSDINSLYYKSREDDSFIPTKELKRLYKSEATSPTFFMQDQMNLLNNYVINQANQLSEEYNKLPTRENMHLLIDELQKLNQLSIDKKNPTDEYIKKVMSDTLSDEPRALITTGFESMDRKIYGFEKGQLNVIAARPSLGKTALALNMMWQMAIKGYTTSFFSLETTGDLVVQRLAAAISKVELTEIKRSNNLGIEKTDKIMNALDLIKKSGLNIFDESNLTPQRVREQAMKQTDKPQIIFIDYLQLMKSDIPTNDRRVEVETISRDLKNIANETGSVIVLLSQLNRGVESRNDKRPMMSDLKESGGIEADANMIMMLYREDYYDREAVDVLSGKSEVEVNIAKNKDGETGVIKLDFYKKIQRFFDV